MASGLSRIRRARAARVPAGCHHRNGESWRGGRSRASCCPRRIGERAMAKSFTRKPDRATDAPVPKVKNYITPSGLQRLLDERRFLLTRERPAVTKVVAWAASNGDRSENADYQYGKRRLRQIDRRIRFLTKRIDAAEVVDPEAARSGQASSQVFFGATVRYANAAGTERVVSIVGARRGRSGSQLHQLGVAAGARADEVRARRPRGPARAGRYGAPGDPGGAVSAHPRGALQRTPGGRGGAESGRLARREIAVVTQPFDGREQARRRPPAWTRTQMLRPRTIVP